MVVDVIDFRIQEPRVKGFNKAWYSHKFHKAGIRYEVATCVNTGHIVWLYGPFPAGRHDTRTIYRLGLKQRLRRGELVWTDGGYRGDATILHRFLPGLSQVFLKEMARGQVRHDTTKGRLIDWAALRDVYRHDLKKHHLIFGAVAIITQLEMMHGFTPF
jgi:hypothetical protein